MTDAQATQHWAVTVDRNGERILTLETNSICGPDLSTEDERVIALAGEALIGFVGARKCDMSHLRRVAVSLIEAFPGFLGMTPDPWPSPDEDWTAPAPHNQRLLDDVVLLLAEGLQR